MLFRILRPDGSQLVVQVPDFPRPIEPAWTRELAEVIGVPVAHKPALGEPWNGILLSDKRDAKTGKVIAQPVPLTRRCQALLDVLPEPQPALELPG